MADRGFWRGAGARLDEEIAALEALAAGPPHQAILLATLNGASAGTCLLVARELEPCHPVSPWLAGLYVAPEYRRRGVGKCLVRAIENEARERGNACLHLYTDDDATAYYEALDWRVAERSVWKGHPTVLMVREL